MAQDDSDSEQSPSNQTPAPPRTPTQTPAVRFDPAELLDQDITLNEMLSQAGSGAGHGELVQLPQEEPRNPDALDDRRRSDVNEWGRSEHMREIARRVYDPIYKHWFRVEWEGLEKIPEGGALLVANHAAAIPSDAPVIMHGIETELNRPVYGLADNFFRTIPVVGTIWNRLGGLPAHPDNAYRLLREQDQLVLVFPEGTKGPSKTYSERYQLRRFGRGGFVEIAMRAGVPVVPIAVVGAEESMPTLFRVPSIARALGVPYLPVTANMLVAGPLGLVSYFPSKFKLKVLDPVHFDVPADRDRYSRSRVMDESEAIRDRIQAALYTMLRERRSVWFG
ncbi:MAG: lysophospholipid acyltransferase family protein [Actinobacteria bacterium]|nr:lysophospholipid acyltransferase family protein [Actinomycetota bacterium]